MTITQTFPIAGNYVSGVTSVTERGSYAGNSGTTILGTYVSTGAERDRILGHFTDTATRRQAHETGSIRSTAGSLRTA